MRLMAKETKRITLRLLIASLGKAISSNKFKWKHFVPTIISSAAKFE